MKGRNKNVNNIEIQRKEYHLPKLPEHITSHTRKSPPKYTGSNFKEVVKGKSRRKYTNEQKTLGKGNL